MQSDQANRFLFPEKYPPRTKIPARAPSRRSPHQERTFARAYLIRLLARVSKFDRKPRGLMPEILELLPLVNKAGGVYAGPAFVGR
jgi:hypothetical protein